MTPYLPLFEESPGAEQESLVEPVAREAIAQGSSGWHVPESSKGVVLPSDIATQFSQSPRPSQSLWACHPTNPPDGLRRSANANDQDQGPIRTLDLLARQIREMETAGRPDRERITSGCPSIDRHLPGGGFARGSLIELIRNGSGTGVTSLSLMIARQAMDEGKFLVIVDPQRQYYPPAMKSLGIPLERVIALQPANHADAIWGLDQVLRCPAIGAVLVDAGNWDDRVSRRLQLACEQGGGLGILMRDIRAARSQPSWADVQWMVRNHAKQPSIESNYANHQQRDVRWFDLELTRCSGGRTGARCAIGIDASGKWVDAPVSRGTLHEHASALHLAAQLAQPTRRRRDIAG